MNNASGAAAGFVFLDCTLRDGGYYNRWDFSRELIEDYLRAMEATGVNVVEVGLRSLKVDGFKGACAYSTDDFLRSLPVPDGLNLGVMVNASELVAGERTLEESLARLFPVDAVSSPVDVVRVACHVHEFTAALPAAAWLKKRGYRVGFNLMQIADRTQEEVEALAHEAAKWPLDVLYFADSMGGMNPSQTATIVRWLRAGWAGALGVHTHDNLGMALRNTLCAMDEGVTWLDATVTGMGRGPGNARTEELVIEVAERRGHQCHLVPLMSLINKHFRPLQQRYGWGTNPYYYLAGKYGIHPTYVQEMLTDSRYSEEDILAVIEHLRVKGGKKFSPDTLDAARHFYQGTPTGSWRPVELLKGREVLLLGTGPGVSNHRAALESYIMRERPVVIALNTQSAIGAGLIDLRVACHPVRLLADCETHAHLPEPLVTPASMLPEDVKHALANKRLLDFGLAIEPNKFVFNETDCILPTALVIAYALAVATSGQATRILMAGFDGYGSDDPRSAEMQRLLDIYMATPGARELIAVTPSRYTLSAASIYAL